MRPEEVGAGPQEYRRTAGRGASAQRPLARACLGHVKGKQDNQPGESRGEGGAWKTRRRFWPERVMPDLGLRASPGCCGENIPALARSLQWDPPSDAVPRKDQDTDSCFPAGEASQPGAWRPSGAAREVSAEPGAGERPRRQRGVPPGDTASTT